MYQGTDFHDHGPIERCSLRSSLLAQSSISHLLARSDNIIVNVVSAYIDVNHVVINFLVMFFLRRIVTYFYVYVYLLNVLSAPPSRF